MTKDMTKPVEMSDAELDLVAGGDQPCGAGLGLITAGQHADPQGDPPCGKGLGQITAFLAQL